MQGLAIVLKPCIIKIKTMESEKEDIKSVPTCRDKKPSGVEIFWAAISYLGVLSMAPLILHFKSGYIKHHARQGLFLFMMEILMFIIFVIPFVGWIIGFFGGILCFIASLVGIIMSLLGKKWTISGVEKLMEKLNI